MNECPFPLPISGQHLRSEINDPATRTVASALPVVPTHPQCWNLDACSAMNRIVEFLPPQGKGTGTEASVS